MDEFTKYVKVLQACFATYDTRDALLCTMEKIHGILDTLTYTQTISLIRKNNNVVKILCRYIFILDDIFVTYSSIKLLKSLLVRVPDLFVHLQYPDVCTNAGKGLYTDVLKLASHNSNSANKQVSRMFHESLNIINGFVSSDQMPDVQTLHDILVCLKIFIKRHKIDNFEENVFESWIILIKKTKMWYIELLSNKTSRSCLLWKYLITFLLNILNMISLTKETEMKVAGTSFCIDIDNIFQQNVPQNINIIESRFGGAINTHIGAPCILIDGCCGRQLIMFLLKVMYMNNGK